LTFDDNACEEKRFRMAVVMEDEDDDEEEEEEKEEDKVLLKAILSQCSSFCS
jgi:hypothetical protein